MFVCLLTLFEMSFAFANTPLEYNIIPSLKENSVVDTKAQKIVQDYFVPVKHVDKLPEFSLELKVA